MAEKEKKTSKTEDSTQNKTESMVPQKTVSGISGTKTLRVGRVNKKAKKPPVEEGTPAPEKEAAAVSETPKKEESAVAPKETVKEAPAAKTEEAPKKTAAKTAKTEKSEEPAKEKAPSKAAPKAEQPPVFLQNSAFPVVRGWSSTSRMLETPVRYITMRSKPRP